MMTLPLSDELRAVLFDLGETLLDSRGITPDFSRDQAHKDFGLVYRYLQRLGKALPSWEVTYGTLAGLLRERMEASNVSSRSVHIGRVMQEAFAELGVSVSNDELRQCILLTYRYSDASASLYPEVLPLIRRLRGQGLLVGLISNTIWPHWCQDATLHRLGVRDLLYPRLYSADLEYKKPHPSIFMHALELLGVNPTSAVFVGDHLDPDIVGAQSVGMKAVWLDVPYREEADPHITPDGRITNLAELPQVLAQIFSNTQKTRLI